MVRKLVLLALTVILLSACSYILPTPVPTRTGPNPDDTTQTVLPPTEAVAGDTATPSEVPSKTRVPTKTRIPTKTRTPTRTPKPTRTPTSTRTSRPTRTPTSTKTSKPTKTPIPSSTTESNSYGIQSDTPLYLQNFAHPDLACNWLGVAGQVFGQSGKPLSGLVVVVDGSLSGKTFEQIGLTGKAAAYGKGGYELVLSDLDVASTSPLTITLFDLAGNALSEPFQFNSLADCKKNLILINFVAK